MKQPVKPIVRLALAAICLLLWVTAGGAAESVCLSCHGGQSGRGGVPVGQWRTSIHAAHGVSCHDCHGGNPADAANAMNPAHGFRGVPQESDIPPFCGRCHVGIHENFRASAHGRTVGRGGPTCVTCHGSHAVQKVSLEIINEVTCGRCHSYRQAAELKESMAATERRFAILAQRLSDYRQQGVDTERQEQKLFAARNRYHRLAHELDVTAVRMEAANIGRELEGVEETLYRVDSTRFRRKIGGAVVIGLALLVALLSALLRRNYEER